MYRLLSLHDEPDSHCDWTKFWRQISCTVRTCPRFGLLASGAVRQKRTLRGSLPLRLLQPRADALTVSQVRLQDCMYWRVTYGYNARIRSGNSPRLTKHSRGIEVYLSSASQLACDTHWAADLQTFLRQGQQQAAEFERPL